MRTAEEKKGAGAAAGNSLPPLPVPQFFMEDPASWPPLPVPKFFLEDPAKLQDLLEETTVQMIQQTMLKIKDMGFSTVGVPVNNNAPAQAQLTLGLSDAMSTLPTPGSTKVSVPVLPTPKSDVSAQVSPSPYADVSATIHGSAVSTQTLHTPGSGISPTSTLSTSGSEIPTPKSLAQESDKYSSQKQGNENEVDIEIELHGPGPEGAEGGKAWKLCKKNPGHVNFIPAPQFEILHMPEGFQNDLSFEWIKLTIALTVRLRVGGASTDRPEGHSYYSVPSGGTRVGSGFMGYVRPIEGDCPCHDCKLEPQSSQKSWAFGVRTGRHVVLDIQEVLKTTVDLYYDDEESRTDGRMKSFSGFREIINKSTHDWCYFECITHDQNLASTISKQGLRWDEIRRSQITMESVNTLSTVVIVSHPHGKSKQVTVGEVKHWKGAELEPWPVGYNADTCPGSSGAPVCVLGRTAVESDNYLPFDLLLHCMGNGVGKWNTGNIVL